MTKTLNMADGKIKQTGQRATLAYMQPIEAITMDIVADYSVSTDHPFGAATLTGGQGTITYAATSAPQGLLAYTSTPPFMDYWCTTEETANTVYAPLPGGRGVDVSQLWGVTPSVAVDLSGLVVAQPDVVVTNQTRLGHSLPVPPSLTSKRLDGKREARWVA